MLPGIVSLPVATVREAFLRITRKAAVSGGVESMTPANLVVDVLRLEAKGVPVPVLIRVMAVFYDQNDRAVYTHRVRGVATVAIRCRCCNRVCSCLAQVLGSALQRIIDRDQELPTLYVRAMLLSLVVFPHKLKEKIVELMRDLASPKRHVWTRPDLYRGFLECVKVSAKLLGASCGVALWLTLGPRHVGQRTAPQCFPVLCTLPIEKVGGVWRDLLAPRCSRALTPVSHGLCRSMSCLLGRTSR